MIPSQNGAKHDQTPQKKMSRTTKHGIHSALMSTLCVLHNVVWVDKIIKCVVIIGTEVLGRELEESSTNNDRNTTVLCSQRECVCPVERHQTSICHDCMCANNDLVVNKIKGNRKK